jgi:hypothetical protein
MTRKPQVHAVIDIDASPDAVWSVLTDFDSYGLWNPFTVSVKTDFVMGAAVKMRVALVASKPQGQTEFITTLDEGRKVCWSMKPKFPSLLGATRCQILEPLEDGGTRYTNQDTILGLFAPVVMLVYGAAMQRGFEAVCRELKVRCEA